MTEITRNFTTDTGRVVTLSGKQRFAQEFDTESRELIYDVPDESGESGVTLTFMLPEGGTPFLDIAALYGCAQRIKIALINVTSQSEIVETIKQKFEEFTSGSFILRGTQEISLTGWQKAIMLALSEFNPKKFARWAVFSMQTATEFLHVWENVWDKKLKNDFKKNPRICEIFEEKFARKREGKVVELSEMKLFGEEASEAEGTEGTEAAS